MPLNPATLNACRALATAFGTPSTILCGQSDTMTLMTVFKDARIDCTGADPARITKVQFDLAVAIEPGLDLDLLLRDLRRSGLVLTSNARADIAFRLRRLTHAAAIVRSCSVVKAETSGLERYQPSADVRNIPPVLYHVFKKIA